MKRLNSLSALSLLLLGCSSDVAGGSARDNDEGALGMGASTADAAQASARDAGGSTLDARSEPQVGSADGSSAACVSVSSAAERLPVHLAFAFDVSGSMGKGDEDWHDKTLKWDPVVQATRSFLEAAAPPDQAATDLHASLTFFPTSDARCEEESYLVPDVPMTPLPSLAFGDAIAEIEPASEDDWRGGTPTLFALRGTRGFIEEYRRDHPGRYAIVLVSDGHPQGCDDEEDRIETVAEEAANAHAAGISTYVIGVENPDLPGAPDAVSNLGQIAEAGGTERAFLIDTGDPDATAAAFEAAVTAIRTSTLSCNLRIPEAPDQRSFDKRKVAVRTTLNGAGKPLVYDASCALMHAWRYDDPAAPSEIVLCPDTCSELSGSIGVRVEVDFACEDVLYL